MKNRSLLKHARYLTLDKFELAARRAAATNSRLSIGSDQACKDPLDRPIDRLLGMASEW